MNAEQLELAITQYLDGTLPAEEAAALQEVLANNSQAVALLEEHTRLTALLRSMPMPEVNWGELAGDFRAVVTGTVDEAVKAQDRKLNAILKSVSPLPPIQWNRLASEISASVDAELEATDARDEQLDLLLHSQPLPPVNWDQLATRIGDAVEQATEGAEVQRERRFKITWARGLSGLALAAALVIAASIGFRLFPGGSTQSVNSSNGGSPAVAVIQGPGGEHPTGPAVVNIQIGPSAAYAKIAQEDGYQVSRPPVVIASPAQIPEDSRALFE